ncbi:MAG: hypothetical protein PHF31_06675 [Methylobacter sp.]|nr:hypothetical protein [Methylobacter sp.]
MTEVLFILTTIFVAYVAYALVSEQKAAAKTQAPIAQPEKKVVAEEQAKPKAVATKAKPAPAKAAAPKVAVAPKPVATKAAAPKATVKPAATKAAAPKVAAKKAATATAHAAGLKDPKTGEVAKTYSNYRFTKRWIKDALVAEGLLDKVYTTNELDTATEAKIKSAIEQLESMPKYQA